MFFSFVDLFLGFSGVPGFGFRVLSHAKAVFALSNKPRFYFSSNSPLTLLRYLNIFLVFSNSLGGNWRTIFCFFFQMLPTVDERYWRNCHWYSSTSFCNGYTDRKKRRTLLPSPFSYPFSKKGQWMPTEISTVACFSRAYARKIYLRKN